jgi:hypothetical protein
MSIAYVVAAILLSAVLLGSARAKLTRDEKVTAGLTKAQVPISWFNPLAVTEIAGALGLLIGIGWRPLGIAAAIGVVLYFVGAVLAHVRAKDYAGAPVPGIILLVAVATLVFALASA